MVGSKGIFALLAVMVSCYGYGETTPAHLVFGFQTLVDRYIFRGNNVEQEWFDQLTNFYKSIDQSIAKMPKIGPSKLSDKNKKLIDDAKQVILEFSSLFFNVLNFFQSEPQPA